MKKIIALILAFILVFSVTGCTPKDTIVGKWKAELDLSNFIKEAFTEDDNLKKYFSEVDYQDLKATLYYEFDKDGEYKAWVDEKSNDKLIETMIEKMRAPLFAYAHSELVKSGTTIYELLDELKLETDQYLEGMLRTINVTKYFGDEEVEFSYKVDGNKLYSAEDEEKLETEKEYMEYVIEGKNLRFTNLSTVKEGEEASIIWETLKNTTFKRVR